MKACTHLAVLLATVLAFRADRKIFAPPPAAHAKSYPAHESHDDEMVSVAIDPFDTPGKARIFRINYREKGFLPIRLIISNDSDQNLLLNDLRIEYITVKRDKIEPATTDDIYRREAHPKQNLSAAHEKVPVTKDADVVETVDELDQAQFVANPVGPHSTCSGFLFLDIGGPAAPEAGAHVYLAGLKIGRKELFYFDIPLEKYLNSQPGK